MFIDGKTHCFGCVFQCMETVTQEDGTDFPEQIGCLAGRLEKYEDNGAEIEEAYNEEQNYYVIKNKLCSMYRTKDWAANQKTISIAKWEELAEEEIMGRLVDVVVVPGVGHTEDNIDEFLAILDGQTAGLPAKVHLMVRHYDGIVPSKYIKMLSKWSFKWEFHHITDETMSTGAMINRVGDKCRSFYYAFFATSFPLQTDFTEKLFDRTYRKLKPFSLCKNDHEYSGVIIQSKAHRVVQGNGHEKSAVFKIQELAEEQKLPHMVINYEELYV